MFEFLKKKELSEIVRLSHELKIANEQLADKELQITNQESKLSALEKDIQERDQKIDSLNKNIDSLSDSLIALQKYEPFRNIDEQIKATNEELRQLKDKYASAYDTFQKLEKEIQIYQDTIDLADYGVYQPHFNFDVSEQYQNEIHGIRERQKMFIQTKQAATGGENITWNGSLAQGQVMVNREKKLMLRAFNGECEGFIADVEWNNVYRMEDRLNKSFEAINKVYEKQGISISEEYKKLKLTELRLAYEYKLKKHEEREEQRAIREQMREEEIARREIEAALNKAQKEEETYQKALAKARQEILSVESSKQEKLLKKIKELEARVAEAEANKERALSMAQQTRRGHVYIISNIGSFGENVYKIGMTRRLDPMDRVRELGDASVPFPFDVHAIIFCEDAPTLENKLHKAFERQRTNLINPRKEFFNVTLDEIEQIVHDNDATIEFTKLAEARDYRETQAIKAKTAPQNKPATFPETIVA